MSRLSLLPKSANTLCYKISVTSVLVVCCGLFSSFPHFFSFRNGLMGASVITVTYLAALFLVRFRPPSWLSSHTLDTLFPVVTSMIILLLGMGALNDGLYASNTGRLSIYGGFMTIGGLMPTSDAAAYLAGMQTFLYYGELSNWSLFKPVSILWAAVLYDLSGEDMVRFLHISLLLYAGSALYLSVISKRHFGYFFSLMLTWGISLYFIYFHGTFLTENFSSPFSILALAILLDGWLSNKTYPFWGGIALLSLAMVMRPGAMFLVPVLIIAAGFRFSKSRIFSWKISAITAFVYSAVLGLSLLQPLLMKFPYPQVSNAAGQLYQIHTKASSWSVYWDIPFPDSAKYLVDIASAKSDFVKNEIKKDPLRFAHNYFKTIILAIPQPECWVFPFTYQQPSWFRWGFLFLFLLTPLIRPRTDPLQWLFLLLCLNLMGSLLSTPMMLELRTRLMMVTNPLHIMNVALGGSNLVYLITKWWSPQLLPGKSSSITAFSPEKQNMWNVYPVVLVIFIPIFSPVIYDTFRTIPQPVVDRHLLKKYTGIHCIMIDLTTTPMALYDMEKDFPVADPYIIPRSKLLSNVPGMSTSFQGKFYLANAVSCVGTPHRRDEKQLLLIPQSLLSEKKPRTFRYVLFKIKKVDTDQQIRLLNVADSVLWTK